MSGFLPRDATQSAVMLRQLRQALRLSVGDLEVTWSHRLEMCENNFRPFPVARVGLPDCCILNTGDFLTMWISVHVPARVPTFNNKKAVPSQVFWV